MKQIVQNLKTGETILEEVPAPGARPGYLGKGEVEAIILSKEKKADLILIDEKKARKAARRAGFEVCRGIGLAFGS